MASEDGARSATKMIDGRGTTRPASPPDGGAVLIDGRFAAVPMVGVREYVGRREVIIEVHESSFVRSTRGATTARRSISWISFAGSRIIGPTCWPRPGSRSSGANPSIRPSLSPRLLFRPWRPTGWIGVVRSVLGVASRFRSSFRVACSMRRSLMGGSAWWSVRSRVLRLGDDVARAVALTVCMTMAVGSPSSRLARRCRRSAITCPIL